MYGSFGLGIDTVRMSLKLTDEIDGQILSAAATETRQRFPYLSLRIRKNEKQLYFEENSAHVYVINTEDRLSLNSEKTIPMYGLSAAAAIRCTSIFITVCRTARVCIWCCQPCFITIASQDTALPIIQGYAPQAETSAVLFGFLLEVK